MEVKVCFWNQVALLNPGDTSLSFLKTLLFNFSTWVTKKAELPTITSPGLSESGGRQLQALGQAYVGGQYFPDVAPGL